MTNSSHPCKDELENIAIGAVVAAKKGYAKYVAYCKCLTKEEIAFINKNHSKGIVRVYKEADRRQAKGLHLSTFEAFRLAKAV